MNTVNYRHTHSVECKFILFFWRRRKLIIKGQTVCIIILFKINSINSCFYFYWFYTKQQNLYFLKLHILVRVWSITTIWIELFQIGKCYLDEIYFANRRMVGIRKTFNTSYVSVHTKYAVSCNNSVNCKETRKVILYFKNGRKI